MKKNLESFVYNGEQLKDLLSDGDVGIYIWKRKDEKGKRYKQRYFLTKVSKVSLESMNKDLLEIFLDKIKDVIKDVMEVKK